MNSRVFWSCTTEHECANLEGNRQFFKKMLKSRSCFLGRTLFCDITHIGQKFFREDVIVYYILCMKRLIEAETIKEEL